MIFLIPRWGEAVRIVLFLLVLLVAGAFIVLDDPLATVGIQKEKEESDLAFRQGSRGFNNVLLRDERIQGRRVAVVEEDWLYCYPDTKEVFLVPRGYATEYASIPGAAQIIVSPFGDHAEAAIIHDWLYAVGENGDEDGRLKADEMFRFAMSEQGVNIVKRNAMFQAVRRGGGGAYGRAEEFEERFRELESGEYRPAPPPIAKPADPAVYEIEDCELLDEQSSAIIAAYGSDSLLR